MPGTKKAATAMATALMRARQMIFMGGNSRSILGEHLHRRGLARTVRPEQAEDLARLDHQIDPVDGEEALATVRLAADALPDGPPTALEGLDEIFRLDRRHGGHSTKISTRSSSSAMST